MDTSPTVNTVGFKIPAAMPPGQTDPDECQDFFSKPSNFFLNTKLFKSHTNLLLGNLYTIFGEKAQNFILDLTNEQKPTCFRFAKKTRVSVKLWDGLTRDVIMQNEYSGWVSTKAGYVRAFHKMAEELKDRVVKEKR